jgi:endonuclease/exonuclease/phosphatase family metal-dependent hydrolase
MLAAVEKLSILGLRFLLRLVEGASWRRVAGLGLAVALGGGWLCTGNGQGLRVATYNIRRFGVEATDLPRRAARRGGGDAAIVGVQEIQSEPRLEELLALISVKGRHYRQVLSRCGGSSEMQVGFVYDEARVKLRGTVELPELKPPGEGACTKGDRPGLVGLFEARGARFALLNVHLKAGGAEENAKKRREQWQRVVQIVEQLRSSGETRIMVLGDVNSTGYLDGRHDERAFVDETARQAGLDLVTRGLGCSEYYEPAKGEAEPSLLDHTLGSPGLVIPGSVRVHGHCAELRCARTRMDEMPPDYALVSDHCPVTVDLRL